MPNEMIEKVAKAMADMHTAYCKLPFNELSQERLWGDLARAAIEAMRTPTQEMCEVGRAENERVVKMPYPVYSVYEKMIDAALKE